jgi:arylsulfatase A-like enzyme
MEEELTVPDKPNVVVVVSDTLRTAYLGCYGNRDVRTPNIDAFAGRSIRFTRAYPESLPTIPVRRTLHTGRRCYPFHQYRPVPWDIVYLPGWQPMADAEGTLAEDLAAAGYQTGFVTDTLPYFAPGFNFQRGFWQWEYVRGQQQDRWHSPYTVSDARLAGYGDPAEVRKHPHHLFLMHLANTAHVSSGEDTTTARVFKWAMRFLEDNVKGQPFYLLVDCFDPHEPWDAPDEYYSLYRDPDYDGKRTIHVRYGPAHEFGYSPRQVEDIKAHYCGLVTLVDAWFGKLMAKLDELGLGGNTFVFFTSDHGTNFCDNPRNIIGKPQDAMYPGVMHLPLLARLPDESGAGGTCNELVYNMDLVTTVYEVTGAPNRERLDGQSLFPLLDRGRAWHRRQYVTCRFAHSLCYIDDDSWILTGVDGRPQEAFDLRSDPLCQSPLAEDAVAERFGSAWERLLADAGGELPDYRGQDQTDAIGLTPAK